MNRTQLNIMQYTEKKKPKHNNDSVSNMFSVMDHVPGSGGTGLPEAALYGGHV